MGGHGWRGPAAADSPTALEQQAPADQPTPAQSTPAQSTPAQFPRAIGSANGSVAVPGAETLSVGPGRLVRMFEMGDRSAVFPGGDVPGADAVGGRGFHDDALADGRMDPRDSWDMYLSGPVEGVDPHDYPELFTDVSKSDTSGRGSRVLPAVVDDMVPGPGLARLLDRVDVAELSGYELVEAAAGWQRLASWVAAAQAATLAELPRRSQMRPADGSGYRSVNPATNTAMEIAGRLCVTTRQAENTVGHAVQLVEDFPATHAALTAGTIDERRARVITAELGGQDPDIRRRVEAAVLPQAGELDAVALRRTIRRLLHQLAPVEAEQRCRDAREERYAAVTPASDGMAHLEAYLPAEDAEAVKATLDAAAEADKRRDAAAGREPRTTDQRRADALASLAWASLSTGRLGGHHRDCSCRCDEGSPFGTALAAAHGRPVTVHVTVPLTTLIGHDADPGELAGYGPIPAHIARHLAAAGIWDWVGTHPATGHVLDHGLTRYRPTQALIDHVILRDRTCRSPGCHRPAIRCEIDHRQRYGDGPTSACNCLPLCKTHHLLKHRGNWRLDQLPSGADIWTSPTGHRYVKLPERVGPVADDSDPPRQPDPDDTTPPF